MHVYIYRRYHTYWLTHKPCIHTIKLNSSDSSPNKCCKNVPLPTGDDLQFNCSSPNRQTIFWIHTFTSTLQIGQVALVWKIEGYSFNSNRFQPHLTRSYIARVKWNWQLLSWTKRMKIIEDLILGNFYTLQWWKNTYKP